MIPTRQASWFVKDAAEVTAHVMGMMDLMSGKSLDADLKTVGPELGVALSRIEASKIDALMEGLLAASEAKVNGAWLPLMTVLDDVFPGRVMDLYQCLFESVRLNYPDFFARLAKAKEALAQGQPAKAP